MATKYNGPDAICKRPSDQTSTTVLAFLNDSLTNVWLRLQFILAFGSEVKHA